MPCFIVVSHQQQRGRLEGFPEREQQSPAEKSHGQARNYYLHAPRQMRRTCHRQTMGNMEWGGGVGNVDSMRKGRRRVRLD